MPDLVTPEGGGLNVGSAGMGTASQLTWSGIIASTGNWRTQRVLLGMYTKGCI